MYIDIVSYPLLDIFDAPLLPTALAAQLFVAPRPRPWRHNALQLLRQRSRGAEELHASGYILLGFQWIPMENHLEIWFLWAKILVFNGKIT